MNFIFMSHIKTLIQIIVKPIILTTCWTVRGLGRERILLHAKLLLLSVTKY